HRFGIVIAFERLQQIDMKRLSPKADAIDASFGQDIALRLVERPRIGLDGPFAARSQGIPSLDDRQEAAKLIDIEPRWSATADEYRVDLARLPHHGNLALERDEI